MPSLSDTFMTQRAELALQEVMRKNLDHHVRGNFREKYYDSQSQRHYHTWEHVLDIATQIFVNCTNTYTDFERTSLYLAALYHDVVYEPTSTTNEEDSVELFKEHFPKDSDIKTKVIEMILATKTHKSTDELVNVFLDMDLNILTRSFEELMIFEHQIFKEFQYADYKVYQERRVEVLEKLDNDGYYEHLFSLIQYVKARQPRIAVYPGSFNPLHKGHLNIIEQAEQMFDKVIVAKGINPDKKNVAGNDKVERPRGICNRQFESYDGTLPQFVDNLDYPVTVIRGLRNSTDLQSEVNQSRFLKEMSDGKMNIAYIVCDSQFEHISSSAIRTLQIYNEADKYLP